MTHKQTNWMMKFFDLHKSFFIVISPYPEPNLIGNIGICKIDLRIPENASLKDKRMVVRSLVSRVRDKFHVSVAEVGNGDKWQLATIGVCCISNDSRHANEMISRILDFIESARLDAELISSETEIISVF